MSGGEANYTPIVLDREGLLAYLRMLGTFAGARKGEIEEWVEAHDVTGDWL